MHCVDVMNKAAQMGHEYDVAEAGQDKQISKIANWRANMIRGALRANASTAFEIEKVIETVFMLAWDAPVDKALLEQLTTRGFSRIPVYHGDKERLFIVGVLMLKSLVKISVTEDEEPKTLGDLAMAGEVEIRDPIYVKRETDINHIMKQFQRGHLHQAVVCDEPDALLKELEAFHKMLNSTTDNIEDMDGEAENVDHAAAYEAIKSETESFNVTGIVSMENVLESLLGMQILDEKDDFKARRATMTDDDKIKNKSDMGFMRN